MTLLAFILVEAKSIDFKMLLSINQRILVPAKRCFGNADAIG